MFHHRKEDTCSVPYPHPQSRRNVMGVGGDRATLLEEELDKSRRPAQDT
jgi:hypothetical protein